MNLRNYTSTVPVERSLASIEKLLVQAGATHAARFYDESRNVSGFLFQIPVAGIGMTFKLPAKPEAVTKVMLSKIRKKHRGTEERIREQSQRTAWKILEEWVHLQLTMIQMEQAEAVQVFLPYAYDGVRDQTFFEKLRDGGFKQLTSGQKSS